jgi:hypothetical protein
MIKKIVDLKLVAMAAILSFTFTGCKDNVEDAIPTVPAVPQKTTYVLNAKDLIGVSGTVSFEETSVGSADTKVVISLTGAPSGSHPAHIHENSAIESGDIIYSLTDIDGSGTSTTVLAVSYSSLINFDGYVNVHLDELNLGTAIAQGDIGGNEIIASNQIYTLDEDSTSGASGTARFDSRKNGNTLVSIDLTTGGSLPDGQYPAQINVGSVSTIGTPIKTKSLNPVDGISRKSFTNVRVLDDGTVITYSNWLVYDGFMTIHDAVDSNFVIASGNIGAN